MGGGGLLRRVRGVDVFALLLDPRTFFPSLVPLLFLSLTSTFSLRYALDSPYLWYHFIAVAAMCSLVAFAFKRTSCSCCVWSCAALVATSSAWCVFCGESSALAFSTVDPVVIASDELNVSTVEVTEVRSLLSWMCALLLELVALSASLGLPHITVHTPLLEIQEK